MERSSINNRKSENGGENGTATDGDYFHDDKKEMIKEEREDAVEEEEESESIERIFENKEVPSWKSQLTVRAFVVSFFLLVMFTFIVMKLNLTTGGFGSYLFGMSEKIAKQSTEADDAQNIKNPGDYCGFSSFPTFGLKAFENRFYFDFSATYVGVGMICAHLINVSLLLGAILSWGIMWPLIYNQRGHWWQPADLSQSSLHGLQGYRIFIGIAMILGDGLYNFIKVLGITLFCLYRQFCVKDQGSVLPVVGGVTPPKKPTVSYDDQRRTQLFLKDEIPACFAVVGYVGIVIISTAVLPHIFHQLKWYYIVVIYVFAPTMAFCNAYGCGLTDWSLASTYGKLAIFTIGAWIGASHGGVLAGLAACGVMMNIVSTASDLMQDFKTGYMTLASLRSIFVSQVIGTAMGCVISPCVFWLFYKAFHDLGITGTQYPAPYALVFRNMAILGVEGFSALPKHCLTLCYVFFIIVVVINAIRDAARKQRAKFIPIPMAMAIPFYIGSYFAIDMCVGSFILLVWQKINKKKADAFGPAVASGLICGDGIWTLPSSILALAGVNLPICMKFLSRTTNAKVDSFLNN
ncbi:hypothetical protein ACSBR2_009409 [Camellia fascicularis]